MRIISILVFSFVMAGCSLSSSRMPQEFSGKWVQLVKESNEVWNVSLFIDGNSWITESVECDVGDRTNRSFLLRQVNEVRVVSKLKTDDGDNAYAIELTRKKATATPLTDAAAKKLYGLWGITDWKANESREWVQDSHALPSKDLIGIDISSSPVRLYPGYCPPSGRLESEHPTKLDKEKCFKKET